MKINMDIFDEEILNLWRLLKENNVAYIMVGGFATNLHGFGRTTSDLDLWLKDTPKNRKNFRITLQKIGLGDFEAIETTEFIPGWTSIYLNSGFELDIMTSLSGFSQERFDECYMIAPTVTIENIEIRFLHLNHLIEAKKYSNRPKDMIDVIELEKIQKGANL